MIQPESKACTLCKVVKPLEDFYWTTRPSGEKARHSRCKVCRRQQFKNWSKTDQGKQVKRKGIIYRNYGITEEQYNLMFEKQNGCCAICKRPESMHHKHRSKPLQLSVDHDHETGEVRALLCSKCNVGLGSFEDRPDFLEAAAAYIKSFKNSTE